MLALRSWLKFLLVGMFAAYMSICLYILHVAHPHESIHLYQNTIVKVISPEHSRNQQDSINGSSHRIVDGGIAVEDGGGSKRNWHFDPSGHEQYHEQQKQEDSRRAFQEQNELFTKSSASSLFQSWLKGYSPSSDCAIDVYDKKLVLLHNVTLNGTLAYAKRKGGETIPEVINQADEDEMYTIQNGYFSVPCRSNSSQCKIYLRGSANHLTTWSRSVTCCSPESKIMQAKMDDALTILITRYEYANVYWTMMDLYDIYLTATFLNETLSNTHLLIVDAHPYTPLDQLWEPLFKKVSRPYQLDKVARFKSLAWTISREHSPFLSKSTSTPLVPQFRNVVLQGFKVPTDHKIACKKQNVLFIWRHNYVAHPRNPKGVISRKISNENELLTAARQAFPGYNVTGVQLDALQMQEQIELLGKTDILIGMHGAAFGFNMLLPSHSAVVEMFPLGSGSNWHMEYIAKWSGHRYFNWTNKDKTLEDTINKSTKVPTKAVIDLLTKAADSLCDKNGQPRALTPPEPTSKLKRRKTLGSVL